jgi:raffinose/stachyose/melibiose transport system permease protein
MFYLVFTLGPSLATAFFSFTDISGVYNAPWHFVGWQNYVEFLTGPAASDDWDAFRRTLVFCASVTLIQNSLALGVALLLNTRLRGRLIVRALVFLPTILGATVIGLIWTLFFNPIEGPAQQFLALFGQQSSFFGDYTLAFPLVIAAQIWGSIGVSVVIFLAGLQTIPRELLEAAQIDGASGWHSFRFVTYPLLAGSVTINILLAVIGSLQTYQIIYVLTNGQFNTSVLGLVVFQSAFQTSGGNGTGSGSLRQGYGASVAMIQFVLVLIVALILRFYLRRREVQL